MQPVKPRRLTAEFLKLLLCQRKLFVVLRSGDDDAVEPELVDAEVAAVPRELRQFAEVSALGGKGNVSEDVLREQRVDAADRAGKAAPAADCVMFLTEN